MGQMQTMEESETAVKRSVNTKCTGDLGRRGGLAGRDAVVEPTPTEAEVVPTRLEHTRGRPSAPLQKPLGCGCTPSGGSKYVHGPGTQKERRVRIFLSQLTEVML